MQPCGRRDRMGSAAELGFTAGVAGGAGAARGRHLGRSSAGAATVAARRRGPRRRSGWPRNLRRVVGPDAARQQLDALVRRAMRSYARYWLEAFRLPAYTPDEDARLVPPLRRGRCSAAAVEAGTGVVIALPHAGNWDAAGAWVAAKGWPITTVAERLKPEGVFEQFLAFRRELGMEIIPLTGGERPPLDVLAERLQERRGRAAAGRPRPVRRAASR